MDEQFMMLIGALDKIPAIIYRYHNYPGVVLPCLNLLSKSAKRMLHSVQPQNVNKYVYCEFNFIHAYAILEQRNWFPNPTESLIYKTNSLTLSQSSSKSSSEYCRFSNYFNINSISLDSQGKEVVFL